MNKNLKKILSIFMALAIIVGIVVPTAYEAKSEKEMETVNVNVGNEYKETLIYNGDSYETGIFGDDLISTSPIYLEGKTRKPIDETVYISEYIEISKLVEKALAMQSNANYDLANTIISLAAEDGFGIEKKYSELVNMDKQNPNLTYIKDFSKNNFKGGTAFDGVLAIKYIKAKTGEELDINNVSTNGALRYFGGVNQAVNSYDEIANLGKDSPSGITKIVITPAVK